MKTHTRSNLIVAFSSFLITGITIAAWAQSANEPSPEPSVATVFTLNKIAADDCFHLLLQLEPNSKFSVDPKTNSIIFIGPAEALKGLTPLWNYVECEEFPNLCEMALASAANEDSMVRTAAIDLLCNSLTIAQRGATAFNSPELKDKAKRLADVLPPEKIIALVSTALSDQDPSKVLATARVVILRSGNSEGSQQGANFDAPTLNEQAIDVLLQLVGGDWRGRNVDGNDRRRALSIASDIRSHQALVSSRLIELLKFDKLDFRATANDSRITRNEILEVLSSKLAPHAKSALPFVEDQLLLISLEQGENSKEVTKLRELISRLKDENTTKK